MTFLGIMLGNAFWDLGASEARLGGILRTPSGPLAILGWGLLGPTLASLASLGRPRNVTWALSRFWVRLGCPCRFISFPWGMLGSSGGLAPWGPVGESWGVSGLSWGSLGGLLGVLGGVRPPAVD